MPRDHVSSPVPPYRSRWLGNRGWEHALAALRQAVKTADQPQWLVFSGSWLITLLPSRRKLFSLKRVLQLGGCGKRVRNVQLGRNFQPIFFSRLPIDSKDQAKQAPTDRPHSQDWATKLLVSLTWNDMSKTQHSNQVSRSLTPEN